MYIYIYINTHLLNAMETDRVAIDECTWKLSSIVAAIFDVPLSSVVVITRIND